MSEQEHIVIISEDQTAAEFLNFKDSKTIQ